MLRAGVIGLGDMGSGLAKNLIKNGFETTGFDLSAHRMNAFRQIGGVEARSVIEVGQTSDVVYVMVMNGEQAKQVILGTEGLVTQMAKGSVVVLSATIKPSEAREIGAAMEGSGVDLIDSPVSGGFPGAQGGTLTMMAAGLEEALEKARPAMEAVSKTIHIVGDKAGEGQTVKSCLQTLIGSIFAATFEAAALAAKAGVSGEVLYKVFSTSGAGCGVSTTALENIIDRKFEGTGSHIATMHKDLTIALDMADQLEVPMQSASTAMQIFHAGKSKYPNGDNWVCTRVIEEIIGAELHR
jgi:3-hydroxyisobutyrate dehydrogenase-like beta-hydroxyacid dehydrogenase